MTPLPKDEHYMQRCLELARKGLGLTRQNPLVGSVIVYNDHIIGEGFHHQYGGPHAEVLAIRSVSDPSLLKNSCLYVNLEPCAHYGKTPPCSMLIKETGIPRVVIGTTDPNPDVEGKGIKILMEGGAKVVSGILEEACRFLNRRFFTFHEQHRPFVILKWAETQDGFIDRNREQGQKSEPAWITNHTARMLVHKWRSEEISIMAGTNTILLDNPALNVREWPGENPIRIIPDKNGKLFEGLQIMDGESPTVIFTRSENIENKNNTIEYVAAENTEIRTLLNELYKRDILSIFVEGGAGLIQSFIFSDLWDETYRFSGNKKFGSGVKAPVLEIKAEEILEFRGSRLFIYRNNIHKIRS